MENSRNNHARTVQHTKQFRLYSLGLILFIALFSLFSTQSVFAQSGPKLQVTKGTLTSEIESGTPFEYTMAYKCASINQNCENVVLTDVLPDVLEFIPDSATRTTHVESTIYTPDPSGATGGTVQWNFVEPLPAGSTGIVRMQVQFKPGSEPGTIASNQASLDASNADEKFSKVVQTKALGAFEMYAEKTLADEEVVAGFPADFSLNICSPDTVGGVQLIPPITITDTLPAEARFIDAEGTEGPDWTYTPAIAPDQGGTIVFTNIPTVTVGGCFSKQITLQFDTIPAPQPVNNMTVTGTPEGCDSGGILPAHCEGQTVRTLTDDLPIEVIAPYPEATAGKSSSSPSSYDSTDARPGEAVTYTVSIDNSGYITLTNVSVTDTVPTDQLNLVSFSAGGTVSRPVTVSYQLTNTGPWIEVSSGNPFTTNAIITIGSEGRGPKDIKTIRWQFTEFLPGDSFNAQVYGTVDGTITPQDESETFDNCVTVTSTESDNAQGCSTVKIVDERAIPRIDKSSQSGAYYPLDLVSFSVELSNADVAHLSLVDPVIADLLPLEFDILTNTVTIDLGNSTAVGASGVITEVLPDYNSTGRTLLRWKWPASFEIAPGEKVVVTYQAQVQYGTPPGVYTNTTALVDWTSPTDPDTDPTPDKNIYLCSGGAQYVDTLNLDGDANTDEVSCQDIQETVVPVALAMDSVKLTRGLVDCTTYGAPTCEDEDFNTLGLTTIGGPMNYKVVMTNTSNVSVTNITLVDIFPFVGDTGVIDTDARLSQWRPNLQAEITGTSGVPLTIYYSTEENPCRAELVDGGPAGCVDDWTETLPADPTSVQAIKLDFCNGDQSDCLVLERDDALIFTWPMVAPNNAPADPSCSTVLSDTFDTDANPDCQIAWNSFGYTAFEYKPEDPGTALKLLPAEPIKVGMRVVTDTGEAILAIGDLVWLDIAGQEYDGIQQTIEQEEWGVSGVRVELYDDNDNYLDYRITGPNNLGQPGYYLFANLITGTYKLRFYPPAGYEVTVQDAFTPTMDALDSDGFITGTDGTYGDFWQTIAFSLTASTVDVNNQDLTWDFGLWKETDYGDANYDGTNDLYPVQASSLITAADAGRHIIVPNFYLGSSVDDELDGVPGVRAWGDDQTDTPDDEDGVTFEDYIGTAALPLGIMQPDDTSTLTIVGTKPSTITTAYLNAWIDWNGDGDWDDAGEQIATDRVFNGGSTTIDVNVPSDAALGTTYARFRYSSEAGLTPRGTAINGEVEDYQIQLVSELEKGLTSTSEAHSAGANVAIGEIARYTLTVQVPEGVLSNFTITDSLPNHLQFLDDGTTKVAFISNDGITTTVASLDSVSGLRVVGSAPVTPTAVLPDAQITPGSFSSGTDPVFTLGTLTNPDIDDDAEYVVIAFNALVLNNGNNNNGQNRDNNFRVTYGEFSETSNNVRITIREPVLRIDKKIVDPTAPLGPGSVVTYEIVIDHSSSPASNLDAFNVVMTDVLPSELNNWQLISITPNGTTVADAPRAIAGNLLRVPEVGSFDLPTTATVTIRLTGELIEGLTPNQLITNTGRIEWTSLPLTGTVDNPTGSVPPGGSGETTGERDGSGGNINDYFTNDPVTLSIGGDWGDLPSLYGTLAANDGPRHTILATDNPTLGTLVDSESDGVPGVAATGDDLADSDDEDGVTFPPAFMPNTTVQVTLTANVTSSAYVGAFFDFNGDGDFDDAGEAYSQTVTSGPNAINVSVPATVTDTLYARFRIGLTENEVNVPTGAATSGEVEDYALLSLGNQLWFDDSGAPTAGGNGLFDGGELTVPAGVTVTLLVSGTSDVITSTLTDSEGKYLFTGLPPGDYQVRIDAENFQPDGELAGYLSTFTAEANPNSDGNNNDNGIDDAAPATNGIRSGGITLSVGDEPSDDGNGTNSNLSVDFGFVNYDWADLPDTYGTLTGSDGPRHVTVDGFYLGASVDDEENGQPSAQANGDDVAGTDDEDGVVFATPLAAGTTARITVTASSAGYLNAWIDFNDNGVFDLNERVASDQALTPGANTLLVSVPTTATGTMASRFRLSAGTDEATTPTGLAPNGEVEDYILASIGDYVWRDTNFDGVQNGGEVGLNGVVVNLLDSAGQPVLDGAGQPITTTTAISPVTSLPGWYEFPGLVPGVEYKVQFVPATGEVLTLQDQTTNGGNDNNDSDADRTTGITAGFTLSADETRTDVDAGVVVPVRVGDYVWRDTNNDGQQGDPGDEPGVPGVVVTLYYSTGVPVLVGGLPLTDTTDNDGLYLFENLDPNDFYVVFDLSTLPPGLIPTAQNLGNDATDSDGNPTTGQTATTGFLASGEEDLTLDLGLVLPDITIKKYTNGMDADNPTGPFITAGDTVTWTYIITNSGEVTLTNVVITDSVLSGELCTYPELAPGDSETCEETGIAITGQYSNTGYVKGTPPTGPDVTDEDDSHYFGQVPGIAIKKYTNGVDADTPIGPFIAEGDMVTWTYVITNTGNVTLTNVVITDSIISGNLCTYGELAPGITQTCVQTDTAISGQYANTGYVKGTPPVDEDVTDEDDSHYFGQSPSIVIKKYTNGEDADSPTGPLITLHDTVTWTYVITNTGNVTLTNVVITDSVIPDTCTYPEFVPNESQICVKTGIAISGQYSNTGTVKGTPPIGDDVTDEDDSHYYGLTPSITIEKYTNGVDADDPIGPFITEGDTVTWTYVITNTGEVTLTNVVITDSVLSGELCTYPELAPGDSETCEETGIAISGQYSNTGTVKGTPHVGPDVTDEDDSHYFGQVPGIILEKYTNGVDADNPTGPFIAEGDTVTWTYVITNAGNVTLTNVVITDSVLTGTLCTYPELVPGATETCVQTGVAITGQYANTGYVKGTPPTGPDRTDEDDSHYFGQVPGIAIKKYTNGEDADTPIGPFITVGDPVTWTYVVTNTGNVTLTNVLVTDSVITGTICSYPAISPGATETCVHTGIAITGQYSNTGYANGTPPVGDDVTDEDDSHYFGQTPHLVIKKYTNGEDADSETGPVVAVGDPITWTYIVTNETNITVTNVTITDDMIPNLNCPVVTLLPSQTTTCIVTGTAVSGQYANIGTVTGTPPAGEDLTDEDPSHYIALPVSVGDYVWYDNNGDGQQGDPADEPGVPGITVTLYISGSLTPISATTTISTGHYLFTDLPPGDYFVGFDFSSLPDGYAPTPSNQGDDASDSDPDEQGFTPSTGFLDKGEQDLTLDLGIVAPVTVGDYVWFDNNGDGQQGDPADEPGVPGITVTLYISGSLTPITTTTTISTGHYLFTDLPPGDYYVEFDLTSLPDGYVVTPPDRGDDASDSDADANGKTPSTGFLYSTDEDLSLDLGIYLPVSVGDYVWYDNNGDGQQGNPADEPGVPDITVTLYYSTGLPVLVDGLPMTTTTDSDGLYLFPNLPPGDYLVGFDLTTLPPGYGTTMPDRGDDSTDSDADETGKTPSTGFLFGGEEDLSLDLGISAPDLVLSKFAQKREVIPGGMITYTLAYTNQGYGVAVNGFISETVPANTTFDADASSSGWSCADGAVAGKGCLFELGVLIPGASGQVTFAVNVVNPVPTGVTSVHNMAHIGSETGELNPTIPNNEDDEDTQIIIPTALEPVDQPVEEPNRPEEEYRIYMPIIAPTTSKIEAQSTQPKAEHDTYLPMTGQ